jgi:hypothetical protein
MKNILNFLVVIALLSSCSTSKYYFNKRLNGSEKAPGPEKETVKTVTTDIQHKSAVEHSLPAEDTLRFPVKNSVVIPVIETDITTGYSMKKEHLSKNTPFKNTVQKIKRTFKRKRIAKQKLIGNSQGDGGVLFLLAILGAIALIIFVHPLVGIGAGIIIIIIAITIAIVGAIAALIVAIVGGLIGAIIN